MSEEFSNTHKALMYGEDPVLFNTRSEDPRIAELMATIDRMNEINQLACNKAKEIETENALLRDAGEKMAEALKLEDHILMLAMLFKGYEGGPLDEPSSTMARYGADTALAAWNEVKG